MSDPNETSAEQASDDSENTQEKSDFTAEAFAEAAEALAGSGSDDSQNSTSTSGGDDLVARLEAERDQYRDAALRAAAELDNYRKRVSREAEQMARFQDLPLIRALLPAIDNLGRTVQAAEQTGNVTDLILGLQMILGQFDQVFTNHNAKPIASIGEMFDPNLHEALQQLPSAEHPPMTVIQELEKGYVLHDRVIRPSKVIVACAPPEQS
jgi:molecular chaperone GrpE